jgi:hypothetical protein
MNKDMFYTRILDNPENWVLWCPKCNYQIPVQKLMNDDPGFSSADLQCFSCFYHLDVLMTPKLIKFNIKDFLFLVYTWIWATFKRV